MWRTVIFNGQFVHWRWLGHPFTGKYIWQHHIERDINSRQPVQQMWVKKDRQMFACIYWVSVHTRIQCGKPAFHAQFPCQISNALGVWSAAGINTWLHGIIVPYDATWLQWVFKSSTYTTFDASGAIYMNGQKIASHWILNVSKMPW